MRRIGFFGGSFDPVHFGHLNLALALQEAHRLDEVWFSPAYISPHKLDDPPGASAEHRLRMVQLAVEGIPNFRVLTEEIANKSPSYTIDAITALLEQAHAKRDPIELYLLLGEDCLRGFSSWRRAEELIELAPPLVAVREYKTSARAAKNLIEEKLEKGLIKVPLMDISANEVRRRLKEGRYCGHLIPAKVLDYISLNGLY